MLLSTYVTQTQRLLQNPAAPATLYSTADIQSWINTARSQLAGESESIRVLGTLTVVNPTATYGFTSITLPASSGYQGVLNVRMATIGVPGGSSFMNSWSWEWFNRYYVSQISAPTGTPAQWSQYAQGVNGSLKISPVPDTTYVMTLDSVCYPIDLTSDADVEAIPYPWTDAVPYFAAYLALLSSQSQARQADANRMFERYEEFVARARRISTAEVLPAIYSQTPDPSMGKTGASG